MNPYEPVFTFLWQDVKVESQYRPERLAYYILVTGRNNGLKYDWVVGPIDEHPSEGMLEAAKLKFLIDVRPPEQDLL